MPPKNQKNINVGFVSNLNKAQRTAIVLSIIITIWFLSGLVLNYKSAPEEGDKKNVSPIVKVQNSEALETEKKFTAYGVTQALRKVNIKSEVPARVVEIKAVEGTFVKAGDVILVLDNRDYVARFNYAEANLEYRALEYKVAKSLSASGYQSATKKASALAALKMAESELESAKIALDNTQIKAPFDGFLEKIYVENGDYIVAAGRDIATVADYSKLIAVAEVPVLSAVEAKIGSPAFVSTSKGLIANGIVKYVGSVADTTTRTLRVEIEIDNKDNNFSVDGATIQMVVPVKKVMAHNITAAAFTLGEKGDVGVKVLGDDNIVKFYPINVVNEDEKGMWITGLPNKARIITVGHLAVKEGQRAEAM